MKEWVNNTYTGEDWLAINKERYENNPPFPHIALENFVQEEQFQALLQALMKQTFEYKESDLFCLAQTNNLKTNEEKTINAFLEMIDSETFSKWIKELTGVTVQAGGTDAFGAIYQDTDYLLPHDDRLENRKIAWILYMTDLQEEQGGALQLYTDEQGHPGKTIKEYRPKKNTLVLFTVSPTSWHEVQEVREADRVTIGGWLHG